MNIKEASNAVLAYLAEQGQFSLSEERITPLKGRAPQEGIISVNTGMGLMNMPRTGQTEEYSGMTMFSILHPEKEKSYLRLETYVGIDSRWQEGIRQTAKEFVTTMGHCDMAVSKMILEVRKNSSDNLYIGVADGSNFDIMEAFVASVIKVKSHNSAITEVDLETRRIKRVTESNTALAIYLWGEDEIWDSQVILPSAGDIHWRSKDYASVDDLMEDFITSKCMRIYSTMTEEIYVHRCTVIENALITAIGAGTIRDDFDGFSQDDISMAALKCLPMLQSRPTLIPVSIPPSAPSRAPRRVL